MWNRIVEKIKFSMVVPVYNVEKYLRKCVKSLVGQEGIGGQLEILLIDDGSRDGSGKLCDKLAKEFSQIRVFHKQNGGLSSARNSGIENARGEYVFFVDSDDYIEPDTCLKISEALKSYGEADAFFFDGIQEADKVHTSMKRIPVKGIRRFDDGRAYLLEHYIQRNFNVEACLYAYRRKFLSDNHLRFKEGILHEDVEFTPRALLLCGKIIELPDCLYHYVIRENSISTQKNREKNIRDLFDTLRKQSEIAEQQEPELRKWMKNAILDSYLNMIQDSRMYRKQYRGLLDKHFLMGKAATAWNRMRVIICLINVRWYCRMNDLYKMVKIGRQKYE